MPKSKDQAKKTASKKSKKRSTGKKQVAQKQEKPVQAVTYSVPIIETVADDMIKLTEFKGEVKLTEFKGDPEILEEIAEILDEKGAVQLIFPKTPLSPLVLRRRIRNLNQKK